MSEARKTLILLLSPMFSGLQDLKDYAKSLQDALVVSGTDIKVFPRQPTPPQPRELFAWLRTQAEAWEGGIALFFWAGEDLLEQAVSKIGTIDQFVKVLRPARKVLVVPESQLDAAHRISRYPALDADNVMTTKPLLLLREGPLLLRAQRELANFLGTRDRPRAPTETLLAVTTGPDPAESEPKSSPGKPIGVLKRRDDETQQVPLSDPITGQLRRLSSKSSGAIEAVKPGIERRDPRREEEDERETLPPPPGLGPPDGAPPRRGEDTTVPRTSLAAIPARGDPTPTS